MKSYKLKAINDTSLKFLILNSNLKEFVKVLFSKVSEFIDMELPFDQLNDQLLDVPMSKIFYSINCIAPLYILPKTNLYISQQHNVFMTCPTWKHNLLFVPTASY